MSFKRTKEDFEEEFTSQYNLENHYDKHVVKRKEYDVTPEEYEAIADKLQRTPIDNKNIFGYISEVDGKEAYVKWNKATEDFVVYTYKNNIPYTISLYKKTYREYNSEMWDSYVGEIPTGK